MLAPRLVIGLTPMATSVRTTLRTTSLQALRMRACDSAYLDALIAITAAAAAAIANEVTTRIQCSSPTHLTRMAQATCGTPWAGLMHLRTRIVRIIFGGAVEVKKTWAARGSH